MPSFTGLLIVVAVAFGAPFLLGLVPAPAAARRRARDRRRASSSARRVLGWVEVDQTIAVVATLGLAFLLFLGGLEIDFDAPARPGAAAHRCSASRSRSRSRSSSRSALEARPGSWTRRCWSRSRSCATSLGVLIPVLKDAGEIGSTLGQLVIAAGSIADFGAIILLSMFFSGEGGTGSTLLLIGALLALAATVLLVVRGAERSMRDPRRPAAAAGHDGPDPRARRAGAARRLRRARRGARARGDPRRVRRRRDPLARSTATAR